MELGIREWMIIIGVLLLIAVLLDGIRRMKSDRRNHIKVAFRMGGGVYDADAPDPVTRDVSRPRPVARARGGEIESSRAHENHPTGQPRIEPSVGEAVDIELLGVESAVGELSSESQSFSESLALAQAKSDAVRRHKGTRVEPQEKASQSAVNDDDLFSESRRGSGHNSTNTRVATERKPSSAFKSGRAGQKRSEAHSMSNKEPVVGADFIIVNVIAKNEQGFNGADLLQVLLACDMRFGKQNIFHRHEQKNGTGPVQFSMANMLEPGYFDLNTIENFQTLGVTFFVTLPGPDDPLKAFDYMVETANCIVKNLDGELKDEERSTMTAQTLAHHRQRVQEFERRQLTASC